MRWALVAIVVAVLAASPAAAQTPPASVAFTDTTPISVALKDVQNSAGVRVDLTNLLAGVQQVQIQIIGLQPDDNWSKERFKPDEPTLNVPRASTTVTVPLRRGGVKPASSSYTGTIVAVGTAGPVARLKVTITDTGFSASSDPAASCASAKALSDAGQDEEAKTAYQDVLTKDPTAACASKALGGLTFKGALDTVTGFGRTLIEWLALVVGVLAVTALALSRWTKTRQWLVDLKFIGAWLDRRFAPRLGAAKFDDDAAFTALVREELVREANQSDYMLDRVTARDSLGTLLGTIEGVDPALKTLGAVLDAVEQFMPRKRFDASGSIQEAKGPDGQGVTILVEGGPHPASSTLWMGADADPDAGHQQLAVPAAAWIGWQVQTALGDPPTVSDARSYALLQGALDAERRSEQADALRLYGQAQAADPTNVPAIINLANLEARGFEHYQEAVRALKEAIAIMRAQQP